MSSSTHEKEFLLDIYLEVKFLDKEYEYLQLYEITPNSFLSGEWEFLLIHSFSNTYSHFLIFANLKCMK